MQNQLEASKYSVILQAMQEKQTDSLSYNSDDRWKFSGVLAQQKIVVNCKSIASGLPNGARVSVDIPQFGLLTKAFLRFTVKPQGGATSAISGLPGIYAFEHIEYATSNGTIIKKLYPQSIFDRVNRMPHHQNARYLKALGDLAVNTTALADGAESDVFYCPLTFDMFDSPATWPDMMTLEQMSFVFQGRPHQKWMVSADHAPVAGLALESCDLICYFAQPTAEEHSRLIASKHPGGASFNYFGSSDFAEAVVTTAATVSEAELELHVPSPVYRTTIACYTDAETYTAYKWSQPVAVTEIELVDSGNTIWKSTYAELNLLESTTVKDTNLITLDWGMLGCLDGGMTAISLHQMSNPRLTVRFADNKKRTVRVVHSIMQAFSESSAAKNRMITVLGDR